LEYERGPNSRRFAELKAADDRGLVDIAEGRMTDFDAKSIITLGRKITAYNSAVDKTLRRYQTFAAIKDDECREWQALPAHVRLDAAGELSAMQYQWKGNEKEPGRDVQPGLQRTLVRVQRASR
jgi:hypothetical protein